MENNKKNFWKGALAGALAMFMVGAAALGIMNVAGVDLGTSQEKVVNAQEAFAFGTTLRLPRRLYS